MAVKIRLKRMGKIRAPYYRIVVADSRTKRDGRVIEEIGKYHPKRDPSFIEVDSDRVQYWLGVGAQPTEPVTAILKVTGDWQKFRGEPAPEPMRMPAPPRDKTAMFNEALKDSHHEPSTEAVTARRASKRAKPEAADSDGAAEGGAGTAPEASATEASATEASATEGSATEKSATEATATDGSTAEAAAAVDEPGTEPESGPESGPETEPAVQAGAEAGAEQPPAAEQAPAGDAPAEAPAESAGEATGEAADQES